MSEKYATFEAYKKVCGYRFENVFYIGVHYDEFCGANGMECRDAICPFVIKLNNGYEKR